MKRTLLLVTLTIFLAADAHASSAPAPSNTPLIYKIRREVRSANGVQINAPHTEDLKIVDFLSEKNIRSFEGYREWLERNFRYREDVYDDVWSPPEETLGNGYGDCEDYAFLSEAVLRVLGFEPAVAGMAGGHGEAGHALCYFKKDGAYAWFDSGVLRRTDISDKEAFLKHLLERYSFALAFDVDPKSDNRPFLAVPT